MKTFFSYYFIYIIYVCLYHFLKSIPSLQTCNIILSKCYKHCFRQEYKNQPHVINNYDSSLSLYLNIWMMWNISSFPTNRLLHSVNIYLTSIIWQTLGKNRSDLPCSQELTVIMLFHYHHTAKAIIYFDSIFALGQLRNLLFIPEN